MAFHLRELRKCSQQSTGSAPSSYKLINETSQLGSRGTAKQHSMDFIFSMQRALVQIPFSPHKESKKPLQRKPSLWHQGGHRGGLGGTTVTSSMRHSHS